ncbi:MAG: 23S rRNA (guanosine(2251)-2'-O)-methyltransferase RlmB [Gammaproteobacteria bacterium GWE2_42_36]|nr:MAG: 23S rRNA (guanosine(2251)-2'-O)-methyltransferase RlmB [Gammaproteobacteria bacterium GWE2_42_36]HCU05617.1 23S rRNA (guanosine(2251)-2'-O)-methyltransferase RlmB [Coxiellaceae bacterium]
MIKNAQLIYGVHAVKAALEQAPERVRAIYLKSGLSRQDVKIQAIFDLAKRTAITVEWKSAEDFQRQFGDVVHQGIAASLQSEKIEDEYDLLNWLKKLKEPVFLLILDHVQDPHNLGACLRTADAAGVHAVIIPKDQAATLTPVVRKVACGAAETVPLITVTNLSRLMSQLKEQGIWLIGMTEEADESLYDFNLTGSLAIVLGAEGQGLRRLTKEHCDHLLHIPMAGAVSSLNVSVATGVCLFEAIRQRYAKSL